MYFVAFSSNAENNGSMYKSIYIGTSYISNTAHKQQ